MTKVNYGKPLKQCVDCEQYFKIEEFPSYNYNGYIHYRNRCRPCYNKNLKSKKIYKGRTGRLPNDGREYKRCIECEIEKPLSQFPQTRSQGYIKYRNRCRECFRNYVLRLPKNQTSKDYGQERKCTTCGIIKPITDFYTSGKLGYVRPDCKICYSKKKSEYQKKDREFYKAFDRLSNRELRLAAITAYGGKCICCGESNEIFLAFDHIYNDGQAHRKAVGSGNALYRWLRDNDYPNTIQILCYNCNWAKSRGGCPHQLVEKS